MLLIDPDEAPLAAWSARARAIGMRAMRSPWVHHCGLDPMALYSHVGGRGMKAGATPPVEVFESHAHELVARSALLHTAVR